MIVFFFSSRRRHTRCGRDWSSDVCSSDLPTSETSVSSATMITPAIGSGWAAERRARARSGERRVGEEGRSRWGPDHLKKKKKRKQEHQTSSAHETFIKEYRAQEPTGNGVT